jgi:hypothetical protein
MIGVRDGGLLNGLKTGFRVALAVGMGVGRCDGVGGEGFTGGDGLVEAVGAEGDVFRTVVGGVVITEEGAIVSLLGATVGARDGVLDGAGVGLLVGFSVGSGVAYSLLLEGGLVYTIF